MQQLHQPGQTIPVSDVTARAGRDALLALVVNMAVFVYHFAKVLKYKRNIAVGVHSDLGEYQALVAERAPVIVTAPVSAAVA